jgi:hypothetical protein
MPAKYTRLEQFNLETAWGRSDARKAGFDVPKRSTAKERVGVAIRFWAKVDKTPGQGPWGDCWGWLGGTHDWGYGIIGKGGRGEGFWRAHRLSWTLAHGPIPEGMDVLHKCDNPPCSNPDHLFLGTALDNTRDCIAKGRAFHTPLPRGEDHHSAKLTRKMVKWIRRYHRPGNGQGQHGTLAIAQKLGVGISAIKRVVTTKDKRRTWKHVT